ncbi:hypothetical protein GCM10010238_15620 [Streptomyces griseoviridis]|uniref:Uncharacterized protein n=1 Tax=Streptomyces griseoviridis TaxID=45398 RepID=A0A918GBP5_STRGD|nr:hypothetical protein GCM10010238_15620 [Streptomyces niveoruber]
MQDRTGVRRAADVEAAPDGQLGVIAPDVHMRSPCVRLVLRGVVSYRWSVWRQGDEGDAPSDCVQRPTVAAREPIDT